MRRQAGRQAVKSNTNFTFHFPPIPISRYVYAVYTSTTALHKNLSISYTTTIRCTCTRHTAVFAMPLAIACLCCVDGRTNRTSLHTHTFLHPSTHIPAMIPLPYKIDDCEPFPFCVPNITILNEFLFSRVFDVNANGSFTIGCTNVADDVAVVLPMVMCYDIRSEETARRARIGQRRLNKQRPQIFQFTTIAKTPRMFRWHFTPPPMMDLIISKRYCCAYCHTY